MMIHDDETCVQVFMKLGLTLLQATIYLNLTKLGRAGVTRISRVSNVARPDVYRVLPALESQGLVEKIIVVPTLYKATPLKEGLSMLLKQKMDEDTDLQKKTKMLLQCLPENDVFCPPKDDSHFIISNEKNLLFKKLREAINTAQIDLNFICTLKVFSKIFFYNQTPLRNALKRNVEIQMVIKTTDNHGLMLRDLEDLQKNPLFNLKYTSDQNPVCMLIADGKEMNVQLSSGLVPSLWSNNPQILKMAVAYFDLVWQKDEYLNLIDKKVGQTKKTDPTLNIS